MPAFCNYLERGGKGQAAVPGTKARPSEVPGEHRVLHLAVGQYGFVMRQLTPSQTKAAALTSSARECIAPVGYKAEYFIRF